VTPASSLAYGEFGLNRRKLYRVDIGADVGLNAKICGKGSIEIGVQLVDLSYAGAGIVVPPSIRQTLQEGQYMALKFESEALEWRISASGRIQNIIELESDFRVGIEFSDVSAVDDQLTPTIRPLFNRRRAYREQTHILGETECKWSPIGRNLAESTFTGTLVDISGCGISIFTAVEHEPILIKGGRYRTQIALKQDDIHLDFTLIARLLHTEIGKHEIRLGFDFEEDDSPFFKDQQSALFRFVAEVQRRILKANSETEKF